MNVCVIDIGSNTVKASIFELRKNRTAKALDYKGIKAKLVSFIDCIEGKRVLSSDGEEVLNNAIQELLTFAASYSCHTVYAFATASLRGIDNANTVVSRIKERYELLIDILSGEEEAMCSLRGVLSDSDIGNVKEGIMVDMGGGSTEIVYFANGVEPTVVSLPIGCLSLYNGFVKNNVPTEEEKTKIEAYVSEQLERCRFIKNSSVSMFLVGGSARAVLKLVSRGSNKKTLRADGMDFIRVTDMLSNEDFFKNADEIIPGRTTTVSPAAIAYYSIVKFSKPTSITVSDSGVREGYLEKILP